MEINKQNFKELFVKLSGKQLQLELPDTYEELFAEQMDPDELDEDLEWLMITCNHQLKNEGINTIRPYKNKINSPHNSSVYLGNVKVQGNFNVSQNTCILGDLEVEGVIYGDIHSILAVCGDIKCEGMWLCRSYFFVLGSINVNQCTLAQAYGFTMIKGNLNSPVYIQDDTWITCDVGQNVLSIENPSLEKIIFNHFIKYDFSDDADLMNNLINIFGNENININDSRFIQFSKLFALIGNKKKIINY